MAGNSYLYLGIYGFIISFFVLKFCMRYVKSNLFNQNLHINNIQNIHHDNPPRIGGIIYLIALSIVILFFNINELYFILMFIPLGCLYFVEDLYFEISPKLRLITKFLGVYLIFYLLGIELPNTNISFLDSFLNNFDLKILFYTFATISIMNGFNMVDGSNGLSMSLFFMILITLFLKCFLFTISDSALIFKYFYLFIFTALPIFIANYPLGKIFLGDAGAYFLGFIASILIIDFYSTNLLIPPVNALLVLIYPTCEVIFSVLRKSINRKNPLEADNLHLHIMIFTVLNRRIKNSKISNPLVVLVLLPFIFSPLISNVIFVSYTFSTSYALILQIILYLYYYYYFYKLLEK